MDYQLQNYINSLSREEYPHYKDGIWVNIGNITEDFAIIYNEFKANRQHPHYGLRILCDDYAIIYCWGAKENFVPPWSHLTFSRENPPQ